MAKKTKKEVSADYSQKKLMDSFEVGDVVVATRYGRSISNEFYQIIEKDKNKFKVRKLKKQRVSGNFAQGMETYYEENSFEDREIKNVKPSGSKYSKSVYLDISGDRYGRKMTDKEKTEGVWFDYMD